MASYFTHDNGGRPFRVDISGNVVQVFHDKKSVGKYMYVKTFNPAKIFIGKSPLTPTTKFSGGHGPDFDGNSILLYMGDLKYVYIGTCIQSFKAKSEIVSYVSEVGNNDVPYPYALDKDEHVYLIIERVIVPKLSSDPYGWYYNMSEMTPPMTSLDLTQKDIRKWKKTNILKFFIGKEQVNLTYRNGDYEKLNKPMYIVTKSSFPNKVPFPKEDYIELMQSYKKNIGVEPLALHTIIKRHW